MIDVNNAYYAKVRDWWFSNSLVASVLFPELHQRVGNMMRDVEAGEEEFIELLKEINRAKPNSGPPLDIIGNLRGKQSALFQYLWDHSPCTVDELQAAVWPTPSSVLPGAVDKAIVRLRERLEKLPPHYLIDKGGGVITLIK